MLSGMITAPAVAQDPGRVTVEEIPVQVAIRAVTITRIIKTVSSSNSSSSRVIRAIPNS